MSENDFVMISALQHALYCERQFALIHLEQIWSDNLYTAEGELLHAHVDVPHHEKRRRFKQEFSLHIRSEQYGIIGICDLVEYEFDENNTIQNISPVEFKRGRKKPSHVDLVQLCAQALCLDEMTGYSVTYGQIYYLQEHRRTQIYFDESLIEETKYLIERCRAILISQTTPKADYSAMKCKNCSLLDICFPERIGAGGMSVSRFLEEQVRIVKEGITK
nr:CRISPR-associated protein Cas4 [uncultured Sphaerochaeta sp.]